MNISGDLIFAVKIILMILNSVLSEKFCFRVCKILSWFKAKNVNISVPEISNDFFSAENIKILLESILVD